MEFSSLNRKAIKSWMLSRTISLIILILFALILHIILKEPLNDNLWIADLCLAGIIVFPMAINAFVLPFYQFRRHKYLITPDRVELKKGVIVLEHQIIPMSRIQHVVITAGPINQSLKLADVTIHTAGGLHKIPELGREVAEELCALLKERINEKIAAEMGRR